MDDLKMLLVKLNCEPQPLTDTEQQTLEKIYQGLKGNGGSSEEEQVVALEKPYFNWIEPPQPLKFTLESEQTVKTVFETENVIKVSSTSTEEGVFKTIQEAIEGAKENATIVVEGTDYTENVVVDRSLHFVTTDGSLTNTHFEIKTGIVTFMGFTINTDSDTFVVSNGLLSLKDCVIKSSSTRPIISVCQSASLEITKSTINGSKIVDAQNGSVINAISSTLEGNQHFIKSDATFTNCDIKNPQGISIEALSTIVKISNCQITDGKEVAVSIREHCQLIMNDTTIVDIKGAGILLHGFSRMQANNIRLAQCEKAGLIVTHDAAAKVTGSMISSCGLAGCEILYQGQLTLNETWINDHKGSCILADYRSMINSTRCVIEGGKAHGIESGNGSILRINDTQITRCAGSGVLVSSSNLTSQTCEYSGNTEANIVGEEGSIIELTSCSIINGESDGIEAVGGSTINTNSCYFATCKGNHLTGRNLKDVKIVSTTFQEALFDKKGNSLKSSEIKEKLTSSSNLSVCGGLSFEATDMIIIDSCYLNRNSVVINNCKNSIARNSKFNYCITRPTAKPAHYIEVIEESQMLIENCTITKSLVKVLRSNFTLRKCKIVRCTQTTAINGESNSKLILENNEFNESHQAVSVKDNSTLQFSYNKIQGVVRPKTKKDKSLLSDNRIKVINIKEFSTGTIEGNFVSGDYDYAIYSDGQSKVDCTTNQIQIGEKGGIMYTGMSYGKCEDNEFTGKGKPVEYFHGCSSSRKD